MTGNEKNGLSVVSISLPKQTVEAMENAIDEMGYASRSELVRDSLREFMREKATLDRVTGRIEGVVMILYEHSSDGKVGEVRHRYMGTFRSFMHSDFDIPDSPCCEVLIFSGDAEVVRKAFFELRSVKGVKEAHIFIAQ